MQNTKNIVLAVLLVLVIWLSSTIIRLENYHYASQVGLCDLDKSEGDAFKKRVAQAKCFKTVETRTSPLWHLFYALLNE